MLGSAGWQSICDPMLKAAGVDITKVKYVDGGWPDVGHRAEGRQWRRSTLLGGSGAPSGRVRVSTLTIYSERNFSKLPANSFVMRKADFDDEAKRKIYARYFQGWAAGLEYGLLNPRAATQIVMEQFPGLGSQMNPSVATESMMQLASVYHGRWDERKKWGFHIPSSWQLFFDTAKEIGQITDDFKIEDVVKNDLVDEANAFDAAKVKADADGFALSADYGKVDVEAIKASL